LETNLKDPSAPYSTVNGVKPRYDNGGTEFGAMHRDLGPGYWMFDIDRMSAAVEMDLELRRQNEGFVEYRINRDVVSFAAMFEVKGHKTGRALEALDENDANYKARLAMARKLECRLFVVFATSGGQPFEFWEISTDDGSRSCIGILAYQADERVEKTRAFWRDCLKLRL